MDLSQVIHLLDQFANNIKGLPWAQIFEWLGGMTALTAVMVPVYRFIKKHFDRYKQIMPYAVLIGSAILNGISYILTTPTTDPKILAIQTGAMAWTSSTFYSTIAKPVSLAIVRAWIEAKLKDESARRAAVPAGGIPLTVQPDAIDFAP